MRITVKKSLRHEDRVSRINNRIALNEIKEDWSNTEYEPDHSYFNMKGNRNTITFITNDSYIKASILTVLCNYGLDYTVEL